MREMSFERGSPKLPFSLTEMQSRHSPGYTLWDTEKHFSQSRQAGKAFLKLDIETNLLWNLSPSNLPPKTKKCREALITGRRRENSLLSLIKWNKERMSELHCRLHRITLHFKQGADFFFNFKQVECPVLNLDLNFKFQTRFIVLEPRSKLK